MDQTNAFDLNVSYKDMQNKTQGGLTNPNRMMNITSSQIGDIKPAYSVGTTSTNQ